MDWPRGHVHYVSKWTGGPAAGTGGPATRRPVQVDPAAAPTASWVAGEGGVAAGSPPTGSWVTVEWPSVPATGPTWPPVPADRSPVLVAGRRYRVDRSPLPANRSPVLADRVAGTGRPVAGAVDRSPLAVAGGGRRDGHRSPIPATASGDR